MQNFDINFPSLGEASPLPSSPAPAPPVTEEAAPPKPPTQIAGATGIGDVPVTMHKPLSNVVDWHRVVVLPPFQMFAAERMRNTTGQDSLGHAMLVVEQNNGDDVLWSAYCDWHAEKGYWPNENPIGEPKA